MGTMITSCYIEGTTAVPVRIEARTGANGLEIEGLPEAAAREARIRVRAALVSSGREVGNAGSLQIAIRRLDGEPMPPRISGAGLDLPLAVAASEGNAAEGFFFGELSLGGSVRATRGAFLAAECAQALGQVAVMADMGAIPMPPYRPAAALEEVLLGVMRTTEDRSGAPFRARIGGDVLAFADLDKSIHPETLTQVREAVAAGQNMLLVGPPGSGKTTIARRLATLLPEATEAERITARRIFDAAGMQPVSARPFRAPHHTVSQAGLVGGGTPTRPGEATLAHQGVLFLDELPEFARPAIEALLSVLKHGARAGMPAKPLLVAAMNPCPCGRAGAACTCTPAKVERYHARVAPFVKALDMVTIQVSPKG